MGHMAGTDDVLLVFVRYAPLLFIIAGITVVVWLSRQRLPQDLQPDVLAALSDSEALPAHAIRQRPPLDHQNVDLRALETALEDLRCKGLAVRWFAPDSTGQQRHAVYRRVNRSRAFSESSDTFLGGGVR